MANTNAAANGMGRVQRASRAVSVLCLCAWGSGVWAFEDYTGPLGGTTRIYGQFSPSFLAVRDSVATYRAFADNSNSVSRIGLITQRDFDVGEFSLRFETALGVRQSSKISQTGIGPLWDWQPSDIRYLDAAFRISRRGVFSIGQGSMATDQVAMADLSGTTLANSASVPDVAGGMFFRSDTGQLSPIAVKSAFNTFDGVRRARLRYDFKAFHGITLSVSAGSEVLKEHHDEENFDVAATYEGDIGRFSVQGAVGASVTWKNNLRTRKDLVGSLSALHEPSGTSLTLATGQGEAGGQFVYLKFGVQGDWTGLGKLAMSVDYQVGYDIAYPDSKSQAWGIAVVQNLSRQKIDVFAGLRGYGLSGAGRGYADLYALQLGARWRF